ncbi:AAEL002234-PA [Aedes aegypti]|uniref:AAEL002234-PA n=1 Tax=Aedes aegypti TaxID=7159 RepID=Q17IW4_AEDAE|nr:AAEL002234-PA [Aedes aegypti]
MLFEAVQNGDLDKVAALLDNGADVNERDDKFFNTALHRSIFAQRNRPELIDLLISRGADCNALNKKYLTASELALEKKLDDLAKHMILRETEHIDNHLAYYLLIRRGNLQLLEFLISIKRLKYEDEILIIAKAYGELKLKNVPLKEHMEAYLNEILINHDYWLINSGSGKQRKDRVQNVHRIREIVDNVRELFTSYDNYNLMDVDSIFLLRLSYILENIFFIRNQYKELPLHHVEFCIGIFLHIWKNPPHYDIYRTMIDKRQLIIYLQAVADELKKIIALPCYNLTPSPSPPPSAIRNSTDSGSTSTAPSPIGTTHLTSSKARTRFRWSTELNRELMFCYFVVSKGGLNQVGYRKRLHDMWCNRQGAYDYLTEQNLYSQLRRIQRDHLLSDDTCRKLRSEASEYEFDYHCSQTRPLKISDKNRKVFRKLAKNYSRMKELHSIIRALNYVNSVIEMKFNASKEIDVLAMKRVVQVLEETIRNSKDSQNIKYILAIKTLMNRLYNSKCIEEIKSYYAYLFRNNSRDFCKDLEFAPFLLLEINSIVDSIVQYQRDAGIKPSDRLQKIKLFIRKEIDSYKTLHQQFSNTILIIDCIVSKIKTNHSHEKIRHLARSHMRSFQLDRKISQYFLNQLKSQLLHYLYDDLKSIDNEEVQSNSILLALRAVFAIDNHESSDLELMKSFKTMFTDDFMTMIDRLETKTGQSFSFLRQDPTFQKSKDHPNKRYDLLRQCLTKHSITLDVSILDELKQEDNRCAEDKINQMQSLFLDQNMNFRVLNRIDEIAFEMIMLEATWALSPKLMNNAESLLSFVPVLTGRNLRNYLSHGSITYEVLVSNISFKTVLQNALSIIKLSKNIISEIYERYSWDFSDRLECLTHQTNVLNSLRFQHSSQICDTIKRDQYLIGKDHLNHGIVDHLVQTQSCLLLGHLLDLESEHVLLKTLSHQLGEINVIPAGGKLHELIAEAPARIRFCYNLALLSNEEDILLKVVADFGYDHIDAIPMIFNFDKLFISLLENHPDYDVNTDSNVEILHYAVLSGNVELLNLLLDQCNDLNQRDLYNLTPLDVACKLSNLEMIKTLTNAGARWYSNSLSQYTWLFLNNDYEAIVFLKNNDLLSEKITRACINLFLQYCDDDKEEIVEFMLSCVDFSNLYATAAKYRRVHVLNYMIANDERVRVNINRKNARGQAAIHVSCTSGYREIVELLLANYGSVDLQDSTGNTSLHLAVQRGSIAIVKQLLAQDAKIDMENQMSKTPLDLAVQLGNVRMVKLLLKRRQLVRAVQISSSLKSLEILHLLKTVSAQYKLESDASNSALTLLHRVTDEGRLQALLRYFEVDVRCSKFLDTPLHIACLMNRTKLVRVLLQNGANTSLKNCDNLIPLHLAVTNRNAEVVKLLMAEHHQLDPSHVNSALSIAARKGFLDISNILLECGADISVISCVMNRPELYLLHSASRQGYHKILRFLLQERCFEVNAEDSNGLTPLLHAVINSSIQTTEILIQFGANVNHTTKFGQNVLTFATMHDHLDLVRYFVNNFPSVIDYVLSETTNQNNCLHIAALKGSYEMVKYFVKLHLDRCYHLNAQNQDGFTALHICAQTGNEKLFRILLDSGADPMIPLGNRQSILHTAVSNKNLNIVRIVLDRALIDRNALDDDGRSVLHYSVFSKEVSIVREVLKIRGLNVNQQDSAGNSALHLAAEYQYVDIYNLLRRRVDNELRTYEGQKRAIDVLLRK